MAKNASKISVNCWRNESFMDFINKTAKIVQNVMSDLNARKQQKT